MGRVLVTVKAEHMGDVLNAAQGLSDPKQIRSIEVQDALVDTGATMLSLPKRYIAQLGLLPLRTRRARTAAGSVEVQIFSTVRVTVQGRDCPSDVLEVPDDCPVLVGQLILEALDFVVDPVNQRVIGNPEHGGEQIYELY
jgi:clan AA aspartic protease